MSKIALTPNASGNGVFTITAPNSGTNRAIALPDAAGTIPLLAAASNTAITATPAELNILDGVTSTAAELNILDGVTSTAAELNILDGVTSTAAELNIMDGVTATAAEINLIDGGTARGTTAVADGDGFLTNDGGTMRMTKVETLATYMGTKIVGVPSGSVIYYAANAAPTGFLKANGAAISRSTYSALFSAIGTVFGVGDGSSTFNVPDLRGEFIRGWDDAKGTDNVGDGRAFGSAQAGQIGAHKHLSGGTNHNSHSRAYGGATASGNGPGGNITSGQNQQNSETVGGAENSNETRPRNIALLACIKI